jgi:UDP-N-acetylmuramate dehydrogenase
MSLRIDIKNLLRPNVRLSQFTTMQVGGLARFFAEPQTEEELFEVLEYARQENLPYFILGKGSNTIFPDEGWPGIVITLLRYEQDKIIFDPIQPRVTASAGIFLYRLVLACRDRHLGGSEFLANVPGTVGGALIMNAGFSRFPGQVNQISDITEEVTVLNPDGRKETLMKRDLEFSYRHSNLEGKIILGGTFHLWQRPVDEIQKEIKANFDYRNEKQDLKHPSSGSIFKNPGGRSAGQLIDGLGLKGMQIGDAMVSPKHANYFINAGNAKSSDFAALIVKVQKIVFNATGIYLEPEVRLIQQP